MNFKIIFVISFVVFQESAAVGGPVECKRQNEFWSCGGACQDSCKKKWDPCPIHNIVCNNVCYCLPGYVRDDRNESEATSFGTGLLCIPEWQCNNPAKCSGKNEEFRAHEKCENTCARLGTACSEQNGKREQPGCYCKPGFARSEWSTCIKEDECPPGRCHISNEVFTSRVCDKVCSKLEGCVSGATDPVESCFCQTGFVRSTDGGSCMPEWKCYEKKNTTSNLSNY